MENPTMKALLKKTENKYELVAVVSKRAKLIVEGSKPLLEQEENCKPIIQAMNELSKDSYTYHHITEE